jgi:trans-aconitate methyltransferase
MSKEWNAVLYHQISAPQVSWGKKVLSCISLRGDEHLLDAGCGTGRLTRDLLEALPNGCVVALDVSQNMLDEARAYLEPDFAGRIEFLRCDLLDLPFNQEFDGIFSTASFHWVLDHDRLFSNLYRALRPGGWLIAQCGGTGNIEHLLSRANPLMESAAYARYFAVMNSLGNSPMLKPQPPGCATPASPRSRPASKGRLPGSPTPPSSTSSSKT